MADGATGRPSRPAWVPDDLYPFDDRWAELDGHLVHYVDEGDGPPLLLLNGNPSWSFGWRDVILGLRDTFRCVAPDYPGFGLSRAAPGYDYRPGSHSVVVERLVDHLGLRWDRRLRLRLGWPDRSRAGRAPAGAGRRARAGQHLGMAGRQAARAAVLGPARWPARAAARGPAERDAPAVPATQSQARRPDGRGTGGLRRPVPARSPFRDARVPARDRAWPGIPARGRGGSPALADKPAVILWPDSDPGFGDAELARWRALFPDARTVHLRHTSASSSTRTPRTTSSTRCVRGGAKRLGEAPGPQA